MLRRLISTSVEEDWNGINDQIKDNVKAELLLAVQQELDQSIRKKITDVIAELARFLISNFNTNTKFMLKSFSKKVVHLKFSRGWNK